MVGLVKGAMRKSIGNAQLTYDETKEVLLDVEEDVHLPVLTPNSMLHTQPNSMPEMPHHECDDRFRSAAASGHVTRGVILRMITVIASCICYVVSRFFESIL